MSVRRLSRARGLQGIGVRGLVLFMLCVAAGGLLAYRAGRARAGASDAVSCTVVVPANPLTAEGLASPYKLLSPCHQTNADESAFVQATIFDPATSRLSVYNPLVVDAATEPAAAPVVPVLPANAVVGIWFGYNGDTLLLADQHGSLAAGSCVNGLGRSPFGQFAYCNAPAFFAAANRAIASGALTVPPLGTGSDGLACPSTRDWWVVDQDQSDNVTGSFLALGDGRAAQNTAANRATLSKGGAPGFQVRINPSDEGLVANVLDPLLGCVPWTVPDLGDAGAPATSLALNELQAAAHTAAPVALVPLNNPMTMVDGRPSAEKTNLYRAGVDMPPLTPGETAEAYCRELFARQPARLTRVRTLLQAQTSPDPEVARSLFGFLAQRLAGSFEDLGCARVGLRNPVHLTVKGGITVAAAFDEAATSTSTTSVPPVPSTKAPTTSSPRSSAPAPTSPPPTSPPPTSLAPTSLAPTSLAPTSPAIGSPMAPAMPVPTTRSTAPRTTAPSTRSSVPAVVPTSAPPTVPMPAPPGPTDRPVSPPPTTAVATMPAEIATPFAPPVPVVAMPRYTG
jgi:hypothetical protein